jgi:hypothetical protein
VQRKGEALHSYIQRWSVIKNSAEDVSDERAIDAFSAGLRRSDLVEEIDQKSTERAGKGGDTAVGIIKKGENR